MTLPIVQVSGAALSELFFNNKNQNFNELFEGQPDIELSNWSVRQALVRDAFHFLRYFEGENFKVLSGLLADDFLNRHVSSL